jgi:single-strand DNA-binding protein
VGNHAHEETKMNSFRLIAIGNLARDPDVIAKGDKPYTRVCLVGTDYAGRDEQGEHREVVTTLWFVAFGSIGEAIGKYCRKGDQLILEARVRDNTWEDKDGKTHYDHAFVVEGFRFGAPGRIRRTELQDLESRSMDSAE